MRKTIEVEHTGAEFILMAGSIVFSLLTLAAFVIDRTNLVLLLPLGAMACWTLRQMVRQHRENQALLEAVEEIENALGKAEKKGE